MLDLTPFRPQRPLTWTDTVHEIAELFASLSEEIYIVGGAVRDTLLQRPLKDIDLTTSGDGLILARKIANHFQGDFFPLDTERSVGRALINTLDGRLTLDVAKFRGLTLLDDLTDRDFTLNAMAVDLRGGLAELIDPLKGAVDIKDKQLRRCSPHALTDDPIRALRAVRQSVQFGFRIEPETLADVRRVSPLIAEISPERVRDELFKLLSLPRPAAALRIADAVGLLTIILPEVDALRGLQQSAPHMFDGWGHTLAVIEILSQIFAAISYSRTDTTAATFSLGSMVMQLDRFRSQLVSHLDVEWPNERSHRSLLILAGLLHDVGKPGTAEQIESGRWRFEGHEILGAQMADVRAANLRLSNAERTRLVGIIRHHNRLFSMDDMTPLAIHRFWRATGEAGIDVCLLLLADYLGAVGSQLNQDSWLALVERVRLLLEAYYEQYGQLIEPAPLVDGKMLMSRLGLKPGPQIGELLDLLREAQVTAKVHTVDDALDMARSWLEH